MDIRCCLDATNMDKVQTGKACRLLDLIGLLFDLHSTHSCFHCFGGFVGICLPCEGPWPTYYIEVMSKTLSSISLHFQIQGVILMLLCVFFTPLSLLPTSLYAQSLRQLTYLNCMSYSFFIHICDPCPNHSNSSLSLNIVDLHAHVEHFGNLTYSTDMHTSKLCILVLTLSLEINTKHVRNHPLPFHVCMSTLHACCSEQLGMNSGVLA